MGDKVKIKLWAMTDRVGSKSYRTIEFDKEDWESWSDIYKGEALEDELWRIIEWGWEDA